jgi:hypothetical protein
MPERTLAIVFRNPQPKRTPIHTEFYLFRRDGSCTRIDCGNEATCIDPDSHRSL